MTEWIPLLVALVAPLSWLMQETYKAHKQDRKMRRLIFRAEIRDLYRQYTDRGWLTLDEAAEFAELVDAYHEAGGNGSATRMAAEIEKMERR